MTPFQLRNVPVGKGYRKIGLDEVLRVGDERYAFDFKKPGLTWTPTLCPGMTMREANTESADRNTPIYTYRRKVS